MTSRELQSAIANTPADFASPDADFNAVRKIMAPFHGHPLGDGVIYSECDFGGVRCGTYTLEGVADSGKTMLHLHGGALVSCPRQRAANVRGLRITHRLVRPFGQRRAGRDRALFVPGVGAQLRCGVHRGIDAFISGLSRGR